MRKYITIVEILNGFIAKILLNSKCDVNPKKFGNISMEY